MHRYRPLLVGVVVGFVLAFAALSLPGLRLIGVADASPGQARSLAASAAFKAHEAEYGAGTGRAEDVYIWSRRWLDAERAGGSGAAAAKDHLARMKALDAMAKTRIQSGLARSSEGMDTAYYVTEATELVGSP